MGDITRAAGSMGEMTRKAGEGKGRAPREAVSGKRKLDSGINALPKQWQAVSQQPKYLARSLQ